MGERLGCYAAEPHTCERVYVAFLFLPIQLISAVEVPMTDRVQAKQDLQFCCAELAKYQNLSRSGLKRHQMIAIDEIMIELKERIRNLRNIIN